MSWCSEHACPETQCSEYEHGYDANYDAAEVWRRRAWDMKKRLDELQGGSAEWIDVMERQNKSNNNRVVSNG